MGGLCCGELGGSDHYAYLMSVLSGDTYLPTYVKYANERRVEHCFSSSPLNRYDRTDAINRRSTKPDAGSSVNLSKRF